jgi:polar amino acid transport system substrate-binding protein
VKRARLLVVLLVLLVSSPAQAAEHVVLATIDWPPYVISEATGSGFVGEIVEQAMRLAGYDVEFSFIPWARGVRLTEECKVHGFFPAYHSVERERKFILSEPLAQSILGFHKPVGQRVDFQSLQDLRPYAIGVVRGYVNTAAFDKADYLHKDYAPSDLLSLKKLIRGRVDLVVMDKYVGQHLVAANIPSAAHKLEFMEPPLEVKDLHVAFSRECVNSQAVADGFDEAVRRMREKGMLSRTMAEYGFQ